MKLDAFGQSDIGLVRTRNEDAFLLLPAIPGSDCALYAVADGMGGHPGGDVASALAVQAVGSAGGAVAPGGENQLLEQLHREAAARIRARATSTPELAEMGTTLTAILLREGCCHVLHIGDTRLYWLRRGSLACVTRDHTVAQEMVDAGRIQPEEAEGHPMGNVLTRCLGVCPDQRPDLLPHGLGIEAGDTLLLASDGLIKAVPTRDLPDLLAAPSAAEAAAGLVARAIDGGAPDNVTVVVVRVEETSPSPGPVAGFDRFARQPAA